jgi:hypothetical protein
MKTKSLSDVEHLLIRVVALILMLIAAAKVISVELAGLFR